MKIQIKYSGYRTLFRLILISLSLFALCLPAVSQQPADYSSFKPGGEWLDTDGVHIDCHGGNIIYVDSLMTFYGRNYGIAEVGVAVSDKPTGPFNEV